MISLTNCHLENKELLVKPIFIIGAARSGTTMLGEILSQHHALAYWLEPKYIWRYGNPTAPHDIRTSKEATPKVIEYIKKRFSAHLKKSGKARFLEKTPSNVFRVAFINKVFPNALYLHIIRNGYDVCLSAEKKWTQKPEGSAVKRRLMSNEIPLQDLPFYAGATIKEVIGRFFLPKMGILWGPRFKNVTTFRKKHSVLETCAEQWVQSIRYAMRDLDTIPPSQIHELKYEDLLAQPTKELKKLLHFINMEEADVIEYAAKTIKNNQKNYTEKEAEKINSLRPLIEETMINLGYS